MLRTNKKLVSISNYKLVNMFSLRICATSFTNGDLSVICKVFRRQYEDATSTREHSLPTSQSSPLAHFSQDCCRSVRQ
jgi:hypothetical protein